MVIKTILVTGWWLVPAGQAAIPEVCRARHSIRRASCGQVPVGSIPRLSRKLTALVIVRCADVVGALGTALHSLTLTFHASVCMCFFLPPRFLCKLNKVIYVQVLCRDA